MSFDKSKKYIVRSVGAGLFFGYITEKDGTEVTMREARNLWKWAGASNVNELAQTGTQDPAGCMFTMPLDEVVLLNVCEIAACTPEARASIEAVPIWKA